MSMGLGLGLAVGSASLNEEDKKYEVLGYCKAGRRTRNTRAGYKARRRTRNTRSWATVKQVGGREIRFPGLL